MRRKYSLSTKLVSIGVVLLVVALTSIGLTLWVTWQLEGGAAAVNEAGRMRMQTWRLASTAQSSPTPQAVTGLVEQFDQSLALLKNGDPSRPLFMPLDDAVNQRFAQVCRCGTRTKACGWAVHRPMASPCWRSPRKPSTLLTAWCWPLSSSWRASRPF
jgi:nitrate/nitrite-specific signal transduction histidine kinase